MKFLFAIIPALLLAGCQKQVVRRFEKNEEGIRIHTTDGTLGIYPLAGNAFRIRYEKDKLEPLPELIFTSDRPVPPFTVSQTPSTLYVRGKNMQVVVDKKTGSLSFADSAGNTFLSEIPGTRKLEPDSILGEKCYLAEQSFHTAEDEYLFGLGQFQDGNYNLRGISRRLVQVNSQIALPFLYSSEGYGLLWHQYGMTDFNPPDHPVDLLKQEQPSGEGQEVEVTTTAGSRKVSQNQSLYKGEFTVPVEDDYSVFLDLGGMGNRHFVTIDGIPCLDQSNMWLPPAAGTRVKLKAGEHRVQVVCKSDNTPRFSWQRVDQTTTFRSPVTKMLDYVVFYGPSADSIIAAYRGLSGNAPLLPQWAYGFWQCRERYASGSQLVEAVREFRERRLPVDVIVQDWQYWGNRGWGVPQFDETNYPDPAGFIQELHDLNAHFNISIWSNPDKNSALGREFVAENYFIPGTKWLDYFNPDTRKAYWNTLKNNMFDYGVDSWWMDAVEPENDALKGEITFAGTGDFYRLVYPLMVSRAVYEGQRETTSEKRVCILTRSAFLGQQRYGVINWSGDVGGNWDAFRRQIAAGLNYTLCGMPYWTTDIGGFFRPGRSQYTDDNYRELLTRWFQWGAFNPVFRVHGFMSETEPWKYGPSAEEHIRSMLDLRYRLLPYIYSEAWQVTHQGSTMMRPLCMDFREDPRALEQSCEFLFGKSILVAPVTESGARDWEVYLPGSAHWYDFWTGEKFEGGGTVSVQAPLDRIPLFVKAGSILPMGPKVQYASEMKWEPLEIRIYEGADGDFTLYEDEGDGYQYESGAYSTIRFSWNSAEKALTMGDRTGSFPGMPEEREFKLVLIPKDQPVDREQPLEKEIRYLGEKMTVSIGEE